MKHILYIFTALIISSLTLFSCKKADEIVPVLKVSGQTEIVFSADGMQSVTYAVATDQGTWLAVSDQPWCTVTTSATGFTVKATANIFETAPTPATITVTAGYADPVKIQVSQLPLEPVPYTDMLLYEAITFGDALGSQSALFAIDLYKGFGVNDPNLEGLQIWAFSSLINREFDAWEYVCHKRPSESIHKFMAGDISSRYGTFLYKMVDGEAVISAIAVDGTIKVELSGDIYTITTDLVAKDPITMKYVPNIRVKFTGTMVAKDPYY